MSKKSIEGGSDIESKGNKKNFDMLVSSLNPDAQKTVDQLVGEVNQHVSEANNSYQALTASMNEEADNLFDTSIDDDTDILHDLRVDEEELYRNPKERTEVVDDGDFLTKEADLPDLKPISPPKISNSSNSNRFDIDLSGLNLSIPSGEKKSDSTKITSNDITGYGNDEMSLYVGDTNGMIFKREKDGKVLNSGFLNRGESNSGFISVDNELGPDYEIHGSKGEDNSSIGGNIEFSLPGGSIQTQASVDNSKNGDTNNLSTIYKYNNGEYIYGNLTNSESSKGTNNNLTVQKGDENQYKKLRINNGENNNGENYTNIEYKSEDAEIINTFGGGTLQNGDTYIEASHENSDYTQPEWSASFTNKDTKTNFEGGFSLPNTETNVIDSLDIGISKNKENDSIDGDLILTRQRLDGDLSKIQKNKISPGTTTGVSIGVKDSNLDSLEYANNIVNNQTNQSTTLIGINNLSSDGNESIYGTYNIKNDSNNISFGGRISNNGDSAVAASYDSNGSGETPWGISGGFDNKDDTVNYNFDAYQNLNNITLSGSIDGETGSEPNFSLGVDKHFRDTVVVPIEPSEDRSTPNNKVKPEDSSSQDDDKTISQLEDDIDSSIENAQAGLIGKPNVKSEQDNDKTVSQLEDDIDSSNKNDQAGLVGKPDVEVNKEDKDTNERINIESSGNNINNMIIDNFKVESIDSSTGIRLNNQDEVASIEGNFNTQINFRGELSNTGNGEFGYLPSNKNLNFGAGIGINENSVVNAKAAIEYNSPNFNAGGTLDMNSRGEVKTKVFAEYIPSELYSIGLNATNSTEDGLGAGINIKSTF